MNRIARAEILLFSGALQFLQHRNQQIGHLARGLYFDAEMVPYCGRTFRVLKRVKRILNEKTGRMTEFKNPCIILEGVVCESRYSQCRLFCPRSIYSYWREIWLERVSEAQVGAASKELQKAAK